MNNHRTSGQNRGSREDFVTERVQAGQSILGLYPPTDETNRVAFEAWRRERGR